MKISVNDLKNNHVELTVVATPEEFDKQVGLVYERVSKDVAVEGFRKGKVPQKVYEKKYGRESLYQEALDALVQAAYVEALSENQDLQVVSYPKVELKKFDPENEIEILYTVATRPEVTLGDYKSIEVTPMSTDVTEDDIKAEIGRLVERYSEMELVNEPAALGDTVVLDYEGFVEDTAFDGGKGENHSLELGSGQFIPGFEDQVVGLKENDEAEVKVTFPEQYHANDLAGKEAIFKVKVHEVKRKIAPELTDELIAKLELPDVKTEADLETHVKKTLGERKEAQAKEQLQADLITGLVDGATMDVPEEMIDMQVDRMVEHFGHQMEQQGFNLQQYYELTGTDAKALSDQMRPDAVKQLKEALALDALATTEKIEVTEAEVDKQVNEMADLYNMKAEEIKATLPNLEEDIKIQKAIEFLVEHHK